VARSGRQAKGYRRAQKTGREKQRGDGKGAKPAPARRLAAVLSLVCLVGALFALGFAIIAGDVWRLPVVLVADAAAIVGLWYALCRRGAASLAGALVAAGAVVVLFVVTLTGDYHGLPFFVTVALSIVSAASARFALAHRHLAATGNAPATAAKRPRHPVLIMNMKSGGGKAERFHLVDQCHARAIRPIVLKPGDDLLQLAATAIAEGADVIGMAGGDGSQALVASVAAEHGVLYVCVPAGTRNHFALDLGLDRENVVGALDAFFEGIERRVDLARVNGRVFVNNASMGLYAKIVQSEAYRDAKLKTAADMLPDMLGPDALPFDLRFIGPDGSERPTAHLLMVSNDPYQLDHLGTQGTRTRLDLGTLGVVAARIAGPHEAVQFIALEAAGRISSFSGWLEWDTPEFRVDSSAPIEIGIDGEAMLLDPPLVFESVRGALRVRIPHHAPGVTPTAAPVQLTTSTVRALVLTAIGHPAPPS
jgi:diacylglycerol kinase family enzyme